MASFARDYLIKRQYRTRLIARSGCYFISVPRTSSTSIDVEMVKHFGLVHGRPDMFPEHSRYNFYPPHLTARQARVFVGPKTFDKLFTFGLVRDPFDRALSFYRYRLQKDHIPSSMPFSDYVKALEQRDRRWFRYAPFWMSASDFLLNQNDEQAVSQIVRYENRENELKAIGEIIGIPCLGREKRNVSNLSASPYATAYDTQTREMVGRMFQRDIKNFGYRFLE